jgi:hypothetical protein
MFLLALSYHLGASTAVAQAPGNIECIGFDERWGIAVIDHQLHEFDAPLHEISPPIPSASRAIFCGFHGVVLESGEMWNLQADGAWHLIGNIGGAPTSTTNMSWGQVKARYR